MVLNQQSDFGKFEKDGIFVKKTLIREKRAGENSVLRFRSAIRQGEETKKAGRNLSWGESGSPKSNLEEFHKYRSEGGNNHFLQEHFLGIGEGKHEGAKIG